MLDELEVEAGQGAGGLLNDARFSQLFDNADFQIDTSADEYLARHTHLRDGNKAPAKSARARDDESDDDLAGDGGGGGGGEDEGSDEDGSEGEEEGEEEEEEGGGRRDYSTMQC